MKAAVCYEIGQPLQIEDVDLDPPQKLEVRVRIAAVSTCFCDLHAVRGHWGDQAPMVAGHEAAGVVEEVGEDATLVKPGDPVVVSSIRSCGKCLSCMAGSPHLCTGPSAKPRRHLRNGEGTALSCFARTAAFAEQVVVDESQVVRVPEAMPLDRAAVLGCTVISGLGAVVNTARVGPASSVVVIGAGAIGLNALQGAVLAGAHPIIAIDRVDSRLALAESFGATHTVHADAADAASRVGELTHGGASYVFVTVGNSQAIEFGFALLGSRGTEVLVGFSSGASPSLPVDAFISGERRLIGSSMGSTRLQVTVPWLADLYLRGALKLDEQISGRYPLERINDALESLERGEALRNIVVF